MPEVAAIGSVAAIVTILARLLGKQPWKAILLGALIYPLIVQVAHFLLPGGILGAPSNWPFAACVNVALGTAAALVGLAVAVPIVALWGARRKATGARRVGMSILALLSMAAPAVASAHVFGFPLLPFVSPSDDFKAAMEVSVCDVEPHEIEPEPFCVSLPADQFRALVARAEYRYDRGFWKGSSLVIVRLPQGASRRLAASYYGGFFKAVDEPGIWVLPPPASSEFAGVFGQIIHEKFIPERMKRNIKARGRY